MHTAIKQLMNSLQGSDAQQAELSLRNAMATIAHVSSKGVVPRKRASRKIARLSKMVHAMKTAG